MSPHASSFPRLPEPPERPDRADAPGAAAPARPDRAAPARPDRAAPVDFAVDLTGHEMLRRTHVMAALGPDWDPVSALRGEEEAYALLYSGLSPEQQRLYDELVAAGVLPGGGTGHRAAS
ncbi:DUF6400 family protein [Streptomyces sp. bgisy159]|uniref:DUF6400 family protein n=1 Tax=Streptomyces sp. bgisy159 TaxID=3413795 RepID=UPI003F49C9CF